MKVLVFGRGFFGTRLAAALDAAVPEGVDISDRGAVMRALAAHEPDAVVNAAGRNGTPTVNWCEVHREATYRANVIGALNVADACQAHGAYLLHLGSGCVFCGASPSPAGWREDDDANPRSFYARTKYAADVVLAKLPNVGIARLRMPVDHTPAPRNLITRLASYRCVIDVENSVSVVDDAVAAMSALVRARATGIFHVTNPGAMRHRDLLALYREMVDRAHRCELIAEEDLMSSGQIVAPRSTCILSSRRLAAMGITMRPIDVALRDCMHRYAEAVAGERGSSAAESPVSASEA